MTVLAPAVLSLDPRTNRSLTDYRIGLLRSALPFPTTDENGQPFRWTGGVAYRPISGTVPAAADSTFYPCNSGFGVDLEQTDIVEWEPWGIGLGDQCRGGATDEDEETARVTRRLEVQSEYLVGRTFWTGEVGTSDFATLGAPNRPLADSASDLLTATGPVGVVTGFSLAVQYLADTLGSQRGMIHVPPKLLPYLGFYGVVSRTGQTLETVLADHIVIASPGYTGSSPDGEPDDDSSTWIYVTSMVRAAVSEITALYFYNRTANMHEARAIRLALAEWDLQAHAAIQICIPDPGPSCTEVPS